MTSQRSIARRVVALVLPALTITGCWHTEPSLKPPPRPEVLVVPPSDDSRFSSPIEYPKGTLNQDILPKVPVKDNQKGPNDTRFGAGMGSGMGGPGG